MPKKTDKELHLNDDLDSMTHEEQTKLMLLSMRKFENKIRDMDCDQDRHYSNTMFSLWIIFITVIIVALLTSYHISNLPQKVCSTETETMYVDMSSDIMQTVNIPIEKGYALKDINCFGASDYIDNTDAITIYRVNHGDDHCEKNKCGCVVTISREVCEVA